MRKFLVLISLIILSCGLFTGCNNEPSISCTLDEIKIYQNETYVLPNSTIEIENYEEKYTLEIVDTDIAKIVNNRITPVSVGKTKLKISLDGYSEVYCEVGLEVMEGYLAEWISIEKSLVKINKEIDDRGTNTLEFNSNCTEIPTVTYDTELIDYNYKTGIIVAKKIGTTVVNIKFKNCEVSFRVEISNVVYTELLTVNSNIKVFKSTTGKIPFQVFPSGANSYRFWTSSDILKVSDEGYYQAIGVGTAIVYYQYYIAYNSQSSINSFEIEVVDSSIDFAIDILDENMQNTNNFILNKNYKLIISCDQNVNPALFTISSNLLLKSTMTWVDNYGYCVDFSFKNKGENEINVTYVPSKSNPGLDILRNQTVVVYDENDIRLEAYWTAYKQDKIDGKYRLFLNGEVYMPDFLEFRLYLGESVYNNSFDLFLVDGGNLLNIEKIFKPNAVGEYTIVAKIGEEIIDTVIVSVLEA